jgi:hypothetical protein
MLNTLGAFRASLRERLLEADDLAVQHTNERLRHWINTALQHVSSEYLPLQLFNDYAVSAGQQVVPSNINHPSYTDPLTVITIISENTQWAYSTDLGRRYPLEVITTQELFEIPRLDVTGLPRKICHLDFYFMGVIAPVFALWPIPDQNGTLYVRAAYRHPRMVNDDDPTLIPDEFRPAVLDFALFYAYEATDVAGHDHLWQLGHMKAKRAQLHNVSRALISKYGRRSARPISL